MRQLIITKQITNRSDESINRYFLEISKYDLIPAEGDLQALEKLVTANLRFVVSVAKQYQNRGISLPDLINEGNVGLVKAAHKFDEKRGFKFISYAVWWIRQSIIQAISEQSRIVRLPLNKIVSINKVAKVFPLLEQKFQREPTDEEIASTLDINEEEIATTNRIKKHQLSLDAPLLTHDETGLNLYDVAEINNMPAPDSKLLQESIKYEINDALHKLTRREADIIEMSFGLNNTPLHTLIEMSHKIGISTERVRQIKQSGITKLKRLLAAKKSF